MKNTVKIAQINIWNSDFQRRQRIEELKLSLIKKDADVVAIQEVVDENEIVEILSQNFPFYCFSSGMNNGFGLIQKTAIFSKFPIEQKFDLNSDLLKHTVVAIIKMDYCDDFLMYSHHGRWGFKLLNERLKDLIEISRHAEKSNFRIRILCGDMNFNPYGEISADYLEGKFTPNLETPSTFWLDSGKVAGHNNFTTGPENHYAVMQSKAIQGSNVLSSEIPHRTLDKIYSYGWNYGDLGYPINFEVFGRGEDEFSDHYGIISEVRVL